MDIAPAQSRAARGLLDWSQTELGKRSNLSESTIRDFEKGRRVPSINNLAAILAAFESAGVEFLNHGQPGVRMRKGEKTLDARERAETAKTYAREWTAYCKEHNSMAFAEASNDRILIQYRTVSSLETFNLLTLRVLGQGFELDGQTVDEDEMLRIVHEALDSRRL